MTVITISREHGSGGDQIANEVANALHYHFVDRKFIGNIIGQYGYVEFDRDYSTLPSFWERFDAQRENERTTVARLLNDVIQAVAQHGHVVILGRSGFEVLAGFADVLHVRLQAPFQVRVQRIMTEQNLSLGDAEELVRQNDRVRIGFVEEFYRVPWNSIGAFDLVFNTARVDPVLVRNMIVDVVMSQEGNTGPLGPSVTSIDVDRILADSVMDALACHQVHA